MASGFCSQRCLYWNVPLVDSFDDELVGVTPGALNNSSSFLASTSRAFLCNLSCGSSLPLALGHAFAPNNQVDRYTDENLQRAIKFALDFFFQGQEHSQAHTVAAQALTHFEPCE